MAFLSPYTGSGAYDDPFRPEGTDGKQWSAIDLREDCTKVDGECLLEIPNLRKGQLSKGQLDDIVWGRIMPKVQPSMSRGVKEVILGGKLLGSAKVKVQPFEGVDPSDDFVRSNQDPISGNWTNHPSTHHTFRILSNQLTGSVSGDGVSMLYYNATTPANDQWCEWTPVQGSNDSGPACRMSTSAVTFYFAHMNTAVRQLYKCVTGTFTAVGSVGSTSVVANDVVRIEAEGSALRYKINGTLNSSGTDTAITSGSWGLEQYKTTNAFSLWTGGEISAAPSGHPTIKRFGGIPHAHLSRHSIW